MKLLVFDEGEADVTITGWKSLLRQGEANVLPAGRPQAAVASKRFKMPLRPVRST
ncbi:MAG TPA: hypothetical protein VEB87_01990 [Nitrososphaerales archaeon]|nr:hypothetical protein [Nitrososphaerales archaeon]